MGGRKMKIIQANFYVKNDKREDFLADIVPLLMLN